MKHGDAARSRPDRPTTQRDPRLDAAALYVRIELNVLQPYLIRGPQLDAPHDAVPIRLRLIRDLVTGAVSDRRQFFIVHQDRQAVLAGGEGEAGVVRRQVGQLALAAHRQRDAVRRVHPVPRGGHGEARA